MAARRTWKEVHLSTSGALRTLQSYHASSSNEFDRYTIRYEAAICGIETDMPWSLFRLWFSYAGVVMPRDVLIADKPSWEIYADE